MVVEAKAAVEALPVVVVVPAVPVAEEHGGLRLPGAPAAPAAAGGSGCWACCLPGCCCWVCSSALLLWVGAKVTEPERSPRSPQPFSPILDRKQQAVLSVRAKELEIATQRKDRLPTERKQPLEASGPSRKVTKQDTGNLRSWLHPWLLH